MDHSAAKNRILEEIERQNLSVAEVARRASVPYDAVRDLKRGKAQSTSWERANKIAQALGISLEDLNEPAPAAEPIAMIPVYDVQASAGDGMMVLTEDAAYMLEFPRGYLQYITKGANPTHLAIIGVRGDSMLPTLADDDIVMLDRSKRDLSQDGLFVIRDNGDALLVKRIGRARTPGYVTVISDNRSLYDPVEKSLDDIEVIGRVIWAGGKV